MDAIISEVFIKGMSFSEIEQKEEEKGKEIVVREGGEGCYFRLSSIAFSNAVDGFVQFHASVGSFVESCREVCLFVCLFWDVWFFHNFSHSIFSSLEHPLPLFYQPPFLLLCPSARFSPPPPTHKRAPRSHPIPPLLSLYH